MNNEKRFFNLIKKRRSVRAYDPKKKVPDETIKKILNAGRLAPTASNRQPARFHLVTKEDILKKIHRSYSRNWFANAPTVLVVTGRRDEAWIRPFDGFNSMEVDLAIMMDHMILAAESLEVSTCWIIAFDPEIVTKTLNLPKGEIPLLMTPLGYYPSDYKKREMPERKSLEDLTVYY